MPNDDVAMLDMSLDDIISSSKGRRSKPGLRGRGGFRGRGAVRGRGVSKPSRGNDRKPRGTNQGLRNGPNSNTAPGRQQSRGASRSNQLLVSNLHTNVTEQDLYELFGQIGTLRRAFLHIGPNGRSSGIADIVFANANDAERALSTYNMIELDGRPMHISFAPAPALPPSGAGDRQTRGGTRGRQSGSRFRAKHGGRAYGSKRYTAMDIDT